MLCVCWLNLAETPVFYQAQLFLSEHRYSYFLSLLPCLCTGIVTHFVAQIIFPCLCTGIVTHFVAHIFFSELPPLFCKGSSVLPNLLNNKDKIRLKSASPKCCKSLSYLTWQSRWPRSVTWDLRRCGAKDQLAGEICRDSRRRSRPPTRGSARTHKIIRSE